MQVNPQNIDQITEQVNVQLSMAADRLKLYNAMDEQLIKGDLVTAARMMVALNIEELNLSIAGLQKNLEQLTEFKQRMASGLVIPTGPLPPAPVTLK